MTRQEILAIYRVDDTGRIISPGKFEGEPIFAPYFWNIGLQGFADSDNGKAYGFRINKDDEAHKEFPELKKWLGRKRSLRLFESDTGFVYCR